MAAVPLCGLAAGVVLTLAAGAIAFLTSTPLPAVVLGMIGLVCLGAAGEALARTEPE